MKIILDYPYILRSFSKHHFENEICTRITIHSDLQFFQNCYELLDSQKYYLSDELFYQILTSGINAGKFEKSSVSSTLINIINKHKGARFTDQHERMIVLDRIFLKYFFVTTPLNNLFLK